MEVKCPKCHTDNPDTQKFCGECGKQLKPVHAETRTLRTPTKVTTIGGIVSEKYKLLEELGSGGMGCLLYTSPSPRDRQKSRMPSSA